jgi:hypothetical protein
MSSRDRWQHFIVGSFFLSFFLSVFFYLFLSSTRNI